MSYGQVKCRWEWDQGPFQSFLEPKGFIQVIQVYRKMKYGMHFLIDAYIAWGHIAIFSDKTSLKMAAKLIIQFSDHAHNKDLSF